MARIKAVDEHFQLNERGIRKIGRVPGRCHSLSIIGSQGSGKSTFMNYVFGTDFPPADAGSKKMEGTTKGIDMSTATAGSDHLILMDVEGMDSITKMDNRSLEKKLALMTAATSDIVIYNMHYNDVYLSGASGCERLQNLFTATENYYSRHPTLKKSSITLCTVFRYCPEGKNTPELQKNWGNILQQIWSGRPLKVDEGALLKDFFKLEFASLPDMAPDVNGVSDEEKVLAECARRFKQKTEALRLRFMPGGDLLPSSASCHDASLYAAIFIKAWGLVSSAQMEDLLNFDLRMNVEDVAEDVLRSFAIPAIEAFKVILASRGYVNFLTRNSLRNRVLRGLEAVNLPPATESKRKQKKAELMRKMAELTETHNRSQTSWLSEAGWMVARALLPVSEYALLFLGAPATWVLVAVRVTTGAQMLTLAVDLFRLGRARVREAFRNIPGVAAMPNAAAARPQAAAPPQNGEAAHNTHEE